MGQPTTNDVIAHWVGMVGLALTIAGAVWAGVGGVVVTIIGVVLAGVSLHYAKKSSDRKDAEVRVLRERQEPRTIPPEARAAIIGVLRDRVPEEAINVGFVSTGVEPAQLAFALAEILQEANWPAGRPTGGAPVGMPPVGLVVLVSDRAETPPRAVWLETALKAGGLGVRLVRTPNDPFRPGTVTLRVGLKPSPRAIE